MAYKIITIIVIIHIYSNSITNRLVIIGLSNQSIYQVSQPTPMIYVTGFHNIRTFYNDTNATINHQISHNKLCYHHNLPTTLNKRDFTLVSHRVLILNAQTIHSVYNGAVCCGRDNNTVQEIDFYNVYLYYI